MSQSSSLAGCGYIDESEWKQSSESRQQNLAANCFAGAVLIVSSSLAIAFSIVVAAVVGIARKARSLSGKVEFAELMVRSKGNAAVVGIVDAGVDIGAKIFSCCCGCLDRGRKLHFSRFCFAIVVFCRVCAASTATTNATTTAARVVLLVVCRYNESCVCVCVRAS